MSDNNADLYWRDLPQPEKPFAEVIGDPISHSKSPLIHGHWLALLGIDALYRAAHVPPSELADYFAHRRQDLNWRGCNVTVPHKESAVRSVDGLLAGYQDLGAINLVVPRDGTLQGGNTDCDGVAGVLNDYHQQIMGFASVPQDRKFSVGIIGAGGAAKAACTVAHNLGWIDRLKVAVRRPGSGKAMLNQLQITGDEVHISDDDLAGLDILINASTMGMGGNNDSGLSLDHLGDGNVKPLVFDMVYHPLETGLLRTAKDQGFNCADGLQMLIIQAAGAFTLFFDNQPPRNQDRALRDLLIR